jgi:16S rRNA (guanine(966)-N(2))-methyltransferase RsmD
MDQMRESVFACVGDLCGCSFLDIFSGSGIIALEAASRGAARVEAVENDPLKRKTLLQNISISPVRINCHFISAELYVQRAKQPFDFIFLDPPFPYQYKWDLLARIGSSRLVSDKTTILLHRPKKEGKNGEFQLTLKQADSREYGRSVVDFFQPGTVEAH